MRVVGKLPWIVKLLLAMALVEAVAATLAYYAPVLLLVLIVCVIWFLVSIDKTPAQGTLDTGRDNW